MDNACLKKANENGFWNVMLCVVIGQKKHILVNWKDTLLN